MTYRAWGMSILGMTASPEAFLAREAEICYASMAGISYIWGQKHYPIPYNTSRVLGYIAAGVFLWWGCAQLPLEGAAKYALRAVVLLVYLAAAWRLEQPATRSGEAG